MERLSRRRYVRRAALAGAVGAGATLAGCFDDPGEPEEGEVFVTDGPSFEPETIEIDVGETVTWINVGSNHHTVTAYDDEIPDPDAYFASGGFDSEEEARANAQAGALAGGDTYEHAFDVPGEYRYFCIPHESLQQGIVVVNEV